MSRVPYSSTIGSLMYAIFCTRPDIAHAMGVVSMYMNNPGKEHLEEVKWILRYLRGTATHALCFVMQPPYSPLGYMTSWSRIFDYMIQIDSLKH